MKNHQNAGIVGIIITLIDILYNINFIKRLRGLVFMDELSIILIKSAFFIVPAIALISKKEVAIKNIWTWSYPMVLALGLVNVYTADSAIGGGVPMIIIVFPFLLIFTLTVLFKKKTENSR